MVENCCKTGKKGIRALSLIYYKKIANSKRSQFKIQQMAFMLLAVFLFFSMVLLLWAGLQSRNLREKATELERERAIEISGFISGAGEFACSGEENCIDTDKVIFLMKMENYREFWPVAYIKIRKLDGESKEIECDKVNYPDCNIYKVYENKNIVYEGSGEGSYVALCRYEVISGYPTRICELGRIIIGYEIK